MKNEKDEHVINAHLAAMTYLFLSAMGASHEAALKAALPNKPQQNERTNGPQEDEPSPSST